MYRIDDATAATSLPVPEAAGTEGYFTEGNPATNTPATKVRGSWMNGIQEELRSVVVAAGLTPSKTTYTQVRDAVKVLAQQVAPGAVNAAGVNSTGKINGINGANLLFNSSGEFGVSGWTGPLSAVTDPSTGKGVIFTNLAAITANTSFLANSVPIVAGQNIILSGDVRTLSITTGSIYLQFQYMNSSGAVIGFSTPSFATLNSDWARISVADTAPAGAASASALFGIQVGTAIAANALSAKRFKLEVGTTPSLYSQEASIAALGSLKGQLLNVQVFKVNGTYTYTRTAGTVAAYAECQGAGGSGAGTPATGASQCAVGGPGADGAFCSSWFPAGIPSSTTITVGKGGVQVNGGSNNGGASSIGSLMTAPGGRGGSTAGPSAPPLLTGGGAGATGAATGGNLVNSSGSSGAPSIALTTGTNGLAGAAGSPSRYGGAGVVTAGNQFGSAATGPGSGGSGTATSPNQASVAGGPGFDGIVAIYEYGAL